MADPTARTLQLLELLQSAHQRTVAELAERLGVDERTVRRDVARLVALGVRVVTVRGRYGGYRLEPGRRALPLVFSAEEALAVLLGLSRAQVASDAPDVAAQTALAKVVRAVRPEDAGRFDAALDVVAHRAGQERAEPDPGVMLTLADAVDRRRSLDLRYRDRAGVPSRRTVHPYGLGAHDGRWYLVALDAARGEERAFRIDRVRTARALPGTFDAPRPLDVEAWLVEHFVGADYRWRVVLRVRAAEDHVRAHLPDTVARLERLEGVTDPPWYRAEIHADSLDWLPAVIAALGCEVVIDRPDELRDQVAATAARMLDAASRVPG
ncbi:YafY family protein [Isoptericola sp. BMS4]|uniref:helix-turn-helix transcriptional regulator n=1 Tax=Isoptericola sp. BMS4 TaxID=2527875 RepID=UPI00142218F6|nr:YafY family protein [Isoptericola sp. BMS4]